MELILSNLTKQYEDITAVNEINYIFNEKIYCILGPNGSGKSSLFKMISGEISPSAGSISLNGIDCASEAYRSRLGYLPQHFGYFSDFSGIEFLKYMGTIKGLPKSAISAKSQELLEQLNLTSVAKKKVRKYSGGMKQRLGIAQSLLNDPNLLILDEPSVGLDPKEIANFRNIITSISENRIVLISTHNVIDATYMADTIIMMKDGQFIEEGSVDALTRNISGQVWNCLLDQKNASFIESNCIIASRKIYNGEVVLRVISNHKPSENAINVHPTLEDAFLKNFATKGENF